MKPVIEWKLSTKTWTLRDMLASEVIKKGPNAPTFAHAIYDLIKGTCQRSRYQQRGY